MSDKCHFLRSISSSSLSSPLLSLVTSWFIFLSVRLVRVSYSAGYLYLLLFHNEFSHFSTYTCIRQSTQNEWFCNVSRLLRWFAYWLKGIFICHESIFCQSYASLYFHQTSIVFGYYSSEIAKVPDHFNYDTANLNIDSDLFQIFAYYHCLSLVFIHFQFP